jgi:hypothetical protein
MDIPSFNILPKLAVDLIGAGAYSLLCRFIEAGRIVEDQGRVVIGQLEGVAQPLRHD